MIDNVIATRSLVIRYENGAETPFDIKIGSPYLVDKFEYCCEISSNDVIFKGVKKSYGMDSIDCLDYAIQMIDLLSVEFANGRLLWPDGTPYSRVPTNLKMGWGQGGN